MQQPPITRQEVREIARQEMPDIVALMMIALENDILEIEEDGSLTLGDTLIHAMSPEPENFDEEITDYFENSPIS